MATLNIVAEWDAYWRHEEIVAEWDAYWRHEETRNCGTGRHMQLEMAGAFHCRACWDLVQLLGAANCPAGRVLTWPCPGFTEPPLNSCVRGNVSPYGWKSSS